MAWTQSESLESLFRRLAERRKVAFIEEARRKRSEVLEELSGRGLGSSGAMVTAIVDVYASGFRQYGEGLTRDVLELVENTDGSLNPEAARWVREHLEPHFDGSARSTTEELQEGPRTEGLRRTATDAIDGVLRLLKQDLGISLDKAVMLGAPSERAQPVIDASLMDPLVPLLNRRAFDNELAKHLKSATIESPLALARLDVDRFKKVNDDHRDHAIGDEALRGIARIAASSVKGKGTAYRVGGDEFCVLLPNHGVDEAIAVAERLRRTVSETPLTSVSLRLSLSIGVAVFPSHADDADTLQKAADSAAYDAKTLGRNLVRVFGEPPPLTKVETREPERRQPEPGEFTGEEQRLIKLEYFRTGLARCPHDDAVLDVVDMTAQQDRTKVIHVSCPFCGLAQRLD